jgi:hypothetical protein
MGRRGMHEGLWWESQKVRDLQEGLDMGGRIILQLNLREVGCVACTGLIRLKIGTSGGLL